MKSNRAIFLDRDGVINIDRSYVGKIEDFEFCSGVFEALKRFQELGFLLIVVTNQSGIARGYYSIDDFLKLTKWKLNELKRRGVFIDEVYYCQHDPDAGCSCRKPSPGMLIEAKDRFNIDLRASWMIGDKRSDIEAALNAGVENTVLISSDCSDKMGAKYCKESILDIVSIVESSIR